MIAILPDKWVRKAIFDRINNMVVDTYTFPCYDMRATEYSGDTYVIMSTQSNTPQFNKCGDGWLGTILLDVFTRYPKNSGSRLLADNAANNIITLLDGMTLDVASGLTVNMITVSMPADITASDGDKIVHRKIIRYELSIR